MQYRDVYHWLTVNLSVDYLCYWMINELGWVATLDLVVNVVILAGGHGCFEWDLAVVAKAN